MDRFWKVFVIVLALVIPVGVALATRYQYYSLQSTLFRRIDRWTGQTQEWECEAVPAKPNSMDEFLARPGKMCGWHEYQP